MSAFNLEKWSLDVATDQGDVLCAELTCFRLAGVGRTVVTGSLSTPDGREVYDSLATGPPKAGPAGRLAVRGYSLEPERGGFRVTLDLPRLGLDLHCVSSGEWRPNGNGVLLTRGARHFRWSAPRFRASVYGFLAFGSGKSIIRGTGYLEAMRTDIPPWRLRLSEIFRGKAYFPSSTLIFHQLTTGEGALLQNILVKRDFGPGLRWVDDYQFQLDEKGHPGRTVLHHPAFTLSLTEKRMLEGGAGPSPRGTRPVSPWKVLDRLYGPAERRKVLSEAVLAMSGDEERGLAIHERVVWRRGLNSRAESSPGTRRPSGLSRRP